MLSAMPSRRQSSTMRIFSFGRVMLLGCPSVTLGCYGTSVSDDTGAELDFVSSSLLEGYDEPENLPAVSLLSQASKRDTLMIEKHCF